MSLSNLGLGAALLANIGLANIFEPAQNATSQQINIDSANRIFVDASGRQVLFHGVNVVYKVDPYIPSDAEFDSELSLNDEDIANLKKWGMNFVRLGVMWEGV